MIINFHAAYNNMKASFPTLLARPYERAQQTKSVPPGHTGSMISTLISTRAAAKQYWVFSYLEVLSHPKSLCTRFARCIECWCQSPGNPRQHNTRHCLGHWGKWDLNPMCHPICYDKCSDRGRFRPAQRMCNDRSLLPV